MGVHIVNKSDNFSLIASVYSESNSYDEKLIPPSSSSSILSDNGTARITIKSRETGDLLWDGFVPSDTLNPLVFNPRDKSISSGGISYVNTLDIKSKKKTIYGSIFIAICVIAFVCFLNFM